MAYDYDRRRVALAHGIEFFEEEIEGVVDTVKNVQRYGKTMGQALSILRPVTECLKSKPLAKLYVDLKETLDFLPKFIGELNDIKVDFEHLDSACVLEMKRVRESTEPLSIPDVQVPKAAMITLQKRIRSYNAQVTKIFDDTSFSVEDIGNAGSADLRSYEKLIERTREWDQELPLPEDFLNQDVGGLAEIIHEHANER